MRTITTFLIIMVCVPLLASAQDAPSGDQFTHIDRHADNTPASVESSIRSLAAYLTEQATDDLSKTRAIFRWITSNIAYDWSGYRTGQYLDVSPRAVLKNRRSVCQGYAGLFHALGTAAGLEVEIITGHAKGYAYDPGVVFDPRDPNHAWNAVKIDGSWYLLDPTWGAGYIDSEADAFQHRFEEHYFLTPPELFIFDHFPSEQRWQLLDTPVSANEYRDLAYIRPAAFAMGLRADDHPNAMVRTDGDLELTFSGPDTLALRAQLFEDGYGDRERGWCFIQPDGNTYRVRSHFPYDGYFFLRLYVRTESGSQTLRWAAEYIIDVTEDRGDLGVFPEQYPTYFDQKCRLETPMRGNLKAGTTVQFRIEAPTAEAVAIVADSAWTHLTQNGSMFEGDVSFENAGTAYVYTKIPGGTNYKGLLRYTIEE